MCVFVCKSPRREIDIDKMREYTFHGIKICYNVKHANSQRKFSNNVSVFSALSSSMLLPSSTTFRNVLISIYMYKREPMPVCSGNFEIWFMTHGYWGNAIDGRDACHGTWARSPTNRRQRFVYEMGSGSMRVCVCMHRQRLKVVFLSLWSLTSPAPLAPK